MYELVRENGVEDLSDFALAEGAVRANGLRGSGYGSPGEAMGGAAEAHEGVACNREE